MIHGIWGSPFVSLEAHLDLAGLGEVHEEVCLGLAEVAVGYTGGSHRSMGIVPPSLAHEPWVDYGEVLRSLDARETARFLALGDDPSALPPGDLADAVGEERERALTRRQMRWLEYRHRVYFPWKVYYELLPNRYWNEKSGGAGKAFTREARAFFPKTIAFVKRLPFREIGRANIMGLDANDFGTVHRDGDPAQKQVVDHFVTFAPATGKRLFLWDEDARAKTPVTGRAYWFNDSDYHGVEADPFFRYSIRVDGVFRGDFLARLRDARGGAAPP